LRGLESRVLRGIFWSKREEVTGELRKLLNEELTQYCAGEQVENNEIGGACSTYGGEERCIQGFGGET
jgi:hypothetical protein